MTDRKKLLAEWLTQHLQSTNYKINIASADASFRSYYRVIHDDQSFIVMDAPPEHEDCKPFINTTALLLASHTNVPEIIASNEAQGFLLLTDLGDKHYLSAMNEANADSYYHAAIDSLIKFQLHSRSNALKNYDKNLLTDELNLFHEWLLLRYLEIDLSENDRIELNLLHGRLIENASNQPQVFVHRDYHSRNLMVTDERIPGILDHQDAVNGPITYDLVSLLKDSYIYWPENKRYEWIQYYLDQLQRHKSEIKIELQQFIAWFDLMGVQRELKVAGIFARLFLRDNKSSYLKDIPLTLKYICELEGKYSELNWLIDFINKTVLPTLDNKS
ncbi:MAG: phosphotransferase [Pseudomonadota bacterium]